MQYPHNPARRGMFRWRTLALSALACLFAHSLGAQQAVPDSTAATSSVVVTGEEVPSSYGAPPALSRSRFSNLVNAYVLPPSAVYAGLIYQGEALKYNRLRTRASGSSRLHSEPLIR